MRVRSVSTMSKQVATSENHLGEFWLSAMPGTPLSCFAFLPAPSFPTKEVASVISADPVSAWGMGGGLAFLIKGAPAGHDDEKI